MTTEVLARLIIEAQTDAAKQGLSSLSNDISKLNGNLSTSGTAGGTAATGLGAADKAINSLGKAAARYLGPAAIAAGGLAFLKGSIDAAAEAQKVMAQTEAVIKSTGGAAGLSAEEIAKMSHELQGLSTFEDEAIQSGANLLLTFTNIGKETFPAATAAMVDMTTALKTDVSSGVIQLGKALNDPIRGITALQRVGVSFTVEQKELIKTLVETGDVAGAQAIILEELNKEFGGSAAAQVKTYAGQVAQLKNNFGDLQETVGQRVIPGLTALASQLNKELTIQGKLDDAAQDTSGSYEDYLVRINALVVAEGYHYDAQRDMLVAEEKLFGIFTQTRPAVEELTEAEYANAQALAVEDGRMLALANSLNNSFTPALKTAGEETVTASEANHELAAFMGGGMVTAIESAKKAIDEQKGSIEYLKQIMDGAVGNEMESFRSKQDELEGQAEEYRGKIDELNAMEYLTPEQIAELEETQTKLGEVDQALDENATAHEEQTKRILFGIAQQQLAIDGYTTQELSFLNDLAGKWGLIDSETKTATDAIIEAVGEAAASGNWEALLGDLENIRRGVEGIPTSVNIGITTTYTQIGSEPPPPSGGPPPPAPYEPPPADPVYGGQQAHGGDYLVTRPTWFMAGEAGLERATFTPAAAGWAGGGSTWNGNVILNGVSDPRAAAAAVVRTLQDRGIISRTMTR